MKSQCDGGKRVAMQPTGLTPKAVGEMNPVQGACSVPTGHLPFQIRIRHLTWDTWSLSVLQMLIAKVANCSIATVWPSIIGSKLHQNLQLASMQMHPYYIAWYRYNTGTPNAKPLKSWMLFLKSKRDINVCLMSSKMVCSWFLHVAPRSPGCFVPGRPHPPSASPTLLRVYSSKAITMQSWCFYLEISSPFLNWSFGLHSAFRQSVCSQESFSPPESWFFLALIFKALLKSPALGPVGPCRPVGPAGCLRTWNVATDRSERTWEQDHRKTLLSTAPSAMTENSVVFLFSALGLLSVVLSPSRTKSGWTLW